MTTKYALSYHVRNAINDILEHVVFRREEDAIAFVNDFNSIIAAKAFVSIATICDKMRIDISEDMRFNLKRIGFKEAMNFDYIHPCAFFGEKPVKYAVMFGPYAERY